MDNLETKVAAAQAGDRDALEAVVVAIQNDVYRLALRFFWHPEDADDATQEILVRVVTHLGSFEGRSRFKTWVYRVATNALLSMQRKRMEENVVSFDAFADDLVDGLTSGGEAADDALLLEEVKIGCTHAMLLCVDRDQRMSYILGEILELDHNEAAEILEVSPGTFRKRLSRARNSITEFMKRHCGLFDAANACRCARRVAPATRLGRIDRDALLFANSRPRAEGFGEVVTTIRALEETRRAAALYRSHPEPAVRAELAPRLREMLTRSIDTRAR